MLTRTELNAWTKALRDNPDLQATEGKLQTVEGKFCCLGMLCEVQGVPRQLDQVHGMQDTAVVRYDFGEDTSIATLKGELAVRLGSNLGNFQDMGMPQLKWQQVEYSGLACANDNGVPWAVIADHLDKHYPAVED